MPSSLPPKITPTSFWVSRSLRRCSRVRMSRTVKTGDYRSVCRA
jgi:hypothetical protein